MKDNILLFVALICSVIGVLMLWVISENIVLDETGINNLESEHRNGAVRIRGSVAGIIKKENMVLIDIIKPERTTVVLFGKNNISLAKDEKIEIVGHVKEYDGRTEVIADRIDKI